MSDKDIAMKIAGKIQTLLRAARLMTAREFGKVTVEGIVNEINPLLPPPVQVAEGDEELAERLHVSPIAEKIKLIAAYREKIISDTINDIGELGGKE